MRKSERWMTADKSGRVFSEVVASVSTGGRFGNVHTRRVLGDLGGD